MYGGEMFFDLNIFVQIFLGLKSTLWQSSNMATSRRNFRKSCATCAFSLVEVTLALGIVAFAFTAIMGVLPVGLNLFRGATDTSVTNRIVQKVSADLQQADFDAIALSEDQTLFFDEQGTEIKSARDAIYWAKVSIFPSVELPGDSGTGNSDIARVVVQVAHNPGAQQPTEGEDGTWQEGESIRLIKRSFFVARNTPQS